MNANLLPRAAAYARSQAPAEPRPSTNAGYYWEDSISSDVYRYIIAHPGCGRLTVAEDLHVNPSTVGTCATRLREQGRITVQITGAQHRAAYFACAETAALMPER